MRDRNRFYVVHSIGDNFVPTVTMCSKFAWRIFGTLRVSRIIVASLSMTVKTQGDRIIERVLTTIRFLGDVVDFNVSTCKLFAHTTSASRCYICAFLHTLTESHIRSLH